MTYRPIYDFLREHDQGRTADKMAEQLQTLVAAVAQEGKAGTLSLKITLKPMKSSGGVEVTAEVKIAPPKETPGASIFFVSPENNLVRQDPRQQAMDLKPLPTVAHKGVA